GESAGRADHFRLGAADDFAHRAFGNALHQLFLFADVEEILFRILDLPEHRQADVDEVLVARQHQTLILSIADRRLVLGLDGNEFHLLDGPDGEMQTRTCGACILPEPQDNAAFIGLNLIDAVIGYQSQNEDHRYEPSPAPAGRKNIPETVLAALDQLIEIGRRRPATASRRSARPLTPGPATASAALPAATPILVPWHRILTLSRLHARYVCRSYRGDRHPCPLDPHQGDTIRSRTRNVNCASSRGPALTTSRETSRHSPGLARVKKVSPGGQRSTSLK